MAYGEHLRSIVDSLHDLAYSCNTWHMLKLSQQDQLQEFICLHMHIYTCMYKSSTHHQVMIWGDPIACIYLSDICLVYMHGIIHQIGMKASRAGDPQIPLLCPDIRKCTPYHSPIPV